MAYKINEIEGIGPAYGEKLTAAGVNDTAEKMNEVNGEKNLCNASPAASTVQGWIEQAKQTEPKITY